MRKAILLSGCFNSISGYGKKSYDIAKSIIQTRPDLDVLLFNLSWGNTPNVVNDLEPYILKTNQINIIPDLYIHIGLPTEKFYEHSPKNLLFTSANETTIAPFNFLDSINRMYDEVIVPSQFNKQVFENTRYTLPEGTSYQLNKPVRIIHEGIRDIKLAKIDLSEIKEQWSFISVATWLPGEMGEDRKDIGMMIKTFIEGFRNKSNQPALILKTSMGGNSLSDRDNVIAKINEIKSYYSGNIPNIYLIHGDLTDEELVSIYNHYKVKAMVSFTKGESVGRPLLEFAMTGKPVLASGFSGHLDFLSKGHTLLPGTLQNVHSSVANEILIPESQWFSVDYAVAKSQMINMKLNHKIFLEKSLKDRRRILKEFSFDSMALKIEMLLAEYIPKQAEIVIPEFLK